MRDAWRAACLAYRRVRQAGEGDHPAHEAAVEALLEIMPHLSRDEASAQVRQAIHWASVEHTEWFWRGVGDAR